MATYAGVLSGLIDGAFLVGGFALIYWFIPRQLYRAWKAWSDAKRDK